MNIGELIATMGVDTTGLIQARRDMDRLEQNVEKRVNSINARMQTIGKAAQRAGKNMTRYLTLPLTLAGGAAFKLYKDFDSSMTKIVSLVGVAESTVDGWRKDLIKMGPELAKSPQELADALFFVTSAGLRGAEALDVLERSAKLSASGLGETKTVADLLTSAMNAYGSEVLSASQASDILVATIREGKAEAPALAQSMGMVLPIASALSVSFDQVGASIAAMTRTGTDASTASIQLRQILASILKPSNQAEEALQAMGKSSLELRKQIRDDGLLSVLQWLSTAVKDNSDQAENLVSSMGDAFPNVRALSGALDIMGKNAEDNIAIFESLADSTGAADYAFQKVTQTAEFKWNKAINTAKTNLTVLGESISQSIIPLLESFSDKIENVTNWFNSLTNTQQQLIIRIGAVVAAAGPLLTIFGFLASSVIPNLTRAFVGAYKAFNVLRIAMMANPAGAIIAGITAIAGAYLILKDRINGVSEAQKALNAINTEATRSIAKQKSQVDQLYRIAQSEAATLEQRKAAIDELNRIVPQYNNELSIEKINTDAAKKAKTEYIQELIREAKVRAAQAKLQELEEQHIEQVVLKEGERLSFFQEYTASLLYNYGLVGKASEYSANTQEKNLKTVEKQLDSTKTALEEYLDEIMKPQDMPTNQYNDSGGDPTKTMEKFANQMRVITSLSDLYGKSYDKVSNAINLHKKTIEQLISEGLEPSDARIQQLRNSLEELEAIERTKNKPTQKELVDIMDDFANQMRVITSLSDVYGKSYDKASNAIDLHKKTIEQLISEGLEPSDARIQQLRNSLEELEAIERTKNNPTQQELVDITKQVAQSALDSAKAIDTLEDSFKNVNREFDNFINKELSDIDLKVSDFNLNEDQFKRFGDFVEQQKIQLQNMWAAGEISAMQYYNQVAELDMMQRERFAETFSHFASLASNIYSSVANMFAASKERELQAAGDNQSKIDAINKKYARKEKAVSRALAYINIAVAVTKALSSAEFPLNLINAAAVAAAGIIQIKAINAQPLAKGGIVPSGYPNDTYPALLTSGEKITPAAPIPLQNESSKKEQLVCRISRDELLFFIKEGEEAYNNY
jgi:TP901 family phage tail tape measure protein